MWHVLFVSSVCLCRANTPSNRRRCRRRRWWSLRQERATEKRALMLMLLLCVRCLTSHLSETRAHKYSNKQRSRIMEDGNGKKKERYVLLGVVEWLGYPKERTREGNAGFFQCSGQWGREKRVRFRGPSWSRLWGIYGVTLFVKS